VFVRSVRSPGQCPPRPKNTPQPGCPRPATGGPHAPQTAARLSLPPHSSHQPSPSSSPLPRPHRLLPSPTAPRPASSLPVQARGGGASGDTSRRVAAAHLALLARGGGASRPPGAWRRRSTSWRMAAALGGVGRHGSELGGCWPRRRRLLSPAAVAEFCGRDSIAF
jgi:hypothetical protein